MTETITATTVKNRPASLKRPKAAPVFWIYRMRANGASHGSGFQLELSGSVVRTTCLEYWSASTTRAAKRYTKTWFNARFNMSLPNAGRGPQTAGPRPHCTLRARKIEDVKLGPRLLDAGLDSR